MLMHQDQTSPPPSSTPAVGCNDGDFEESLRLTGMDDVSILPGEGPEGISSNVDVDVVEDSSGCVPSDGLGSRDPSPTTPHRRVSWKPAPPPPGVAPGVDGRTSRRNSYADSVTSEEDVSKNSMSISTDGMSERRGSTGSKSNGGSSAVRRRSSNLSGGGFWTSLTRKSDVWDDDDADDLSDIYDPDYDGEGAPPPCWDAFKAKAGQTYRWFRATMMTAVTSRRVAVPCLLLFALTVSSGCLIVWGFDKAAADARCQRAIAVAESTDQFFSGVLENAFVPLFTMAAFVKEVELFEALDYAVGERCDPSTTDCSNSTSAPPLTGKEQTHRNLTGLYETDYGSATLAKFNKVAKDIKDHSGLGRSLVAIQLAPKAVVSLIYPLVNCEDFNDGYCMNNTGAVGHDLLNDPNRTAIASNTVPATDVVTAGPLPLIQGGETFIARLPINFDNDTNHSMVVDGVDYPCWGLAIVSFLETKLMVNATIFANVCAGITNCMLFFGPPLKPSNPQK